MKEPAQKKRKTDQEDKIKELEEKIKKLEEAKEKEESGGVAGGVLRGLGDIIPGLSGLIEGLEKSPAFEERLKKIDEEVGRKLREEPLKRTEGRTPHIRTSFSARTLAKDKSSFEKKAEDRKIQEFREPLVDVFDEGTHLKIIAELPGVEEKDIKVNLKGDKLIISTDIPHHKYHQEVALPCVPVGKIEKSYKNGVLELKITKKPVTGNR